MNTTPNGLKASRQRLLSYIIIRFCTKWRSFVTSTLRSVCYSYLISFNLMRLHTISLKGMNLLYRGVEQCPRDRFALPRARCILNCSPSKENAISPSSHWLMPGYPHTACVWKGGLFSDFFRRTGSRGHVVIKSSDAPLISFLCMLVHCTFRVTDNERSKIVKNNWRLDTQGNFWYVLLF